MNELDGNLTLWNDNGHIELGWNKVRGPEFSTRYFRIEKLGCPDIPDNKGRTPLLPILRPISTEDIEQQKHREGDTDLALLQAIYDDAFGSQRKWADAIGISSSDREKTQSSTSQKACRRRCQQSLAPDHQRKTRSRIFARS